MSSLLIPITVTLGGTQSRPLEDWHIFGNKNPTPYKTKVRIWAGIDYNRANSGRSSLGGTRPKIMLYDELGRHLGNTLAVPKDGILDKKPKEGIPEGSFRDYEIEIWDRQNENASRSWVRGNTRASYIAISAGKLASLMVGLGPCSADNPRRKRRHLHLRHCDHVS
jgi:hypothetical protein